MTRRTSPRPPSRDELRDVLVERVEADVEVDRVDEPARARPGATSSADSAEVIASGFSHTTWLPGGEDPPDLRVVELVGRGDVDDLDALVGEQLVEARVGLRQAELARPAARRAPATTSRRPCDADADAAQRLDVDGADEPAADDGGADVADASHAGQHLGRPERPSKRLDG